MMERLLALVSWPATKMEEGVEFSFNGLWSYGSVLVYE